MRESEEAERQEPAAGVEREAAAVEAGLGLVGQELPSLHLPAVGAPFAKGLVRLAASAPGRAEKELKTA
ncbi:hypothetical protein [Streptomyces echinatus]|uniref:Uncharacterized protein n=1 Tax=Streptomyces echinatus TaxID=67293 RepID=A0A7W9PRS9_9ACTN|nr:hypothetical protein [Streptomyces echinatus]MBB5926484.1 hypothetical protein [Streptomyces echinatus]